MARLKISGAFQKILDLHKSVHDKDALDGLTSIIRPYLATNSSSISIMQTAANNATTANTNFNTKDKLVKILKGDLKKKYDPKLKFYHLASQVVKTSLGVNYSGAAAWGIDIDENGEISYSTDKNVICANLLIFINYHLGLPAGTSALTAFLAENTEYDVAAMAADIPATITKNNDYHQAIADRKTYKGQRVNYLKPLLKTLKGVGKFLKGTFIMNPAKCGDWGYIVIISPKDAKLKNLDFGHLEEKTISNVTNGSDLVNTKLAILKAYKGKTPTGTAMTVPVGGKIIVPKNWGTMTIVSQSDSEIGGITYLGK